MCATAATVTTTAAAAAAVERFCDFATETIPRVRKCDYWPCQMGYGGDTTENRSPLITLHSVRWYVRFGVSITF